MHVRKLSRINTQQKYVLLAHTLHDRLINSQRRIITFLENMSAASPFCSFLDPKLCNIKIVISNQSYIPQRVISFPRFNLSLRPYLYVLLWMNLLIIVGKLYNQIIMQSICRCILKLIIRYTVVFFYHFQLHFICQGCSVDTLWRNGRCKMSKIIILALLKKHFCIPKINIYRIYYRIR